MDICDGLQCLPLLLQTVRRITAAKFGVALPRDLLWHPIRSSFCVSLHRLGRQGEGIWGRRGMCTSTCPSHGRLHLIVPQLWCWVTTKWNVLRIAAYYGPVWLIILVTI